MSKRNAELNLHTYSDNKTVRHYAALNYLTPCERMLFGLYIRPASAILDLGVGGGRTTPFLAQRASCYVGVDYIPAMIEECRRKFPTLEFTVADAANLSAFGDASFDAVVFAFNGIDFVIPDSARLTCLQHIRRVLKPGGVVVFSSHNARSILVRPSWNSERLLRAARRLSLGSQIVGSAWIAILTGVRVMLAYGQALLKTLSRIVKRIPTKTFWCGEGCLLDSAHGGLYTHYTVPGRVITELEALNFCCDRILGDDFPLPSHPLATDWYYYVFIKPLDK